jgi:hypothetical protein
VNTSALRVLVLLASLLLAPRTVLAHQASTVYLQLTIAGRDATLSARVAAEDLGEPTGLSPLIVPSRAQFERHRERAMQYIAEHLRLSLDHASCPLRPDTVSLAPRDDRFDVTFTYVASCPRQIDVLTIHDDLFFDVDPRHQALLSVRAFGTTQQHVLRIDHRDVTVRGEPSRLAQAREYTMLGIEHILTGYDHLAFLLALLVLAAARPRREGFVQVLSVVTAFTVAHTITLALAVTGVVRLPSRVVESAIALSIAYVALENVLRPSPRPRWPLTFAFGLVHGLGFASALAETGLPARGTALALVAFNVGVEMGQLAVVMLVYPMLRVLHGGARHRRDLVSVMAFALATMMLLIAGGASKRAVIPLTSVAVLALFIGTRRVGYERAVQRGLSLTLVLFASWWLVERIAGRVWFGGWLG